MSWRTMLQIPKGMRKTVDLSGRPLEVRCTSRAVRALTRRSILLVAEMELAFACFARKEVHFHDPAPDQDITHVTDKLAVRTTTVIPEYCGTSKPAERPVPKPSTAVHMQNFVPRWLNIDFRDGKWVGEYGL
ncbi:MAG: hypothetical protein HY081_10185 [Gammaproteobacteria bacterium]|nr:hypothetical protein [Gammaproteobacteria bacterium]